ncbi:MAG TPA: F0F1 ATP synthase subunit epsilon [Candidatus Margulisiibacteriota bacterium]|nr:F0F1 ATP synthase subunit epsilon [Candidatus Margulisiibacteriota bacterium]
MAPLFKLSIYTPGETIFDAQVSSLCIPEESGYLGVLAHHAPLISTLKPGKISFKDEKGILKTIPLAGKGIFEIANNRVIILLD